MRASNVRMIEATWSETEKSFPFMSKSVLLRLTSCSRRPTCPGKRCGTTSWRHGIFARQRQRDRSAERAVRLFRFDRAVETVGHFA